MRKIDQYIKKSEWTALFFIGVTAASLSFDQRRGDSVQIPLTGLRDPSATAVRRSSEIGSRRKDSLRTWERPLVLQSFPEPAVLYVRPNPKRRRGARVGYRGSWRLREVSEARLHRLASLGKCVSLRRLEEKDVDVRPIFSHSQG